MNNPKLLNGQNLAFLGDAYLELMIRKHLIEKGITKSSELKKKSLDYVSAHAHCVIFNKLEKNLTEDEMIIFKRGRNSSNNSYRKNLNVSEHTISSGIEALIGYHYLEHHEERLQELIDLAIAIVEEEK